MFYEFINEKTIKKAPKPLKVDGKDIFTNDEKTYNKYGYFKLIQTDYPSDEKYYNARYALKQNVIVQSWVEVEIVSDTL